MSAIFAIVHILQSFISSRLRTGFNRTWFLMAGVASRCFAEGSSACGSQGAKKGLRSDLLNAALQTNDRLP